MLSFSSLGSAFLPRFFTTVFSHLNSEATRPVSWCVFFTFLSVRIYFMDWSVPDLYFRVYSALRFLSEVTCTTWHRSLNSERLNCAFGLPYIKITSLCTHRKWPWSQMSLFYLSFSHFRPCFWSAGEPGLYLVWSFLPKGILYAALKHSGPHV